MLVFDHAERGVLGKLLGVVGRAAAFKHNRVAFDAHGQIADAAGEAGFDSLADGDRELTMTLVAAVYLFGVRFGEGPGGAEDDFGFVLSGARRDGIER